MSVLDGGFELGDATRDTAGASTPSLPRAQAGERRGTVGAQDRAGAHAVIHPGARRGEASVDDRRALVTSPPDVTRTFARKTARFFVMSAAIVAVSLLSAALFNALVPSDHFGTTSFLPQLGAWMGGAFVGLAAGIAALYKAGAHR